ncbi:MAG: asparagine synthase (glutamine-hydrolyzing) [Planctomycetaceae bacterium]|nr:asparagine synthase (glutamine-hydrolyzing) [Planctomycetaceae bacterium]
MCGFAGASWTESGPALDAVTLDAMTRVLVHRGPDQDGSWQDQFVALGHRRLSIIDLDSGRQPLANEDGSVQVVFNGEIYNYRELRGELIARGHHFTTNSDTEVLVHLYEDHGIDCVDHLRGMFAFALWDRNRRRLLLARDRMGQKPLVYREEAGRLLFASELKALLQVPGTPRELDPVALDQFLAYQYVPHPRTMLAGYRKLPPAHRGVYEDGRLTIDRYWRPGFENPIEDRSTRDWQDQLRATLTEAVGLRLRSDVPLGAFLSGGIDSTIIAGLMQEQSSTPIHTFSIGFPVRRFDERQFARIAADHLGTTHHESVVEPRALEILPKLAWFYDEPFGDSSAIPTMCLAEMTRAEVTVALSGDGGDELFAGYDRYRAVALAERIDRLPRPLRAIAASRIWQFLPASTRQKSLLRRLKRFADAIGKTPQRRYLEWVGIFDRQRRRSMWTDGFLERLAGSDAAEFLLETYLECPDRDFVTQTTCADVLSYLPCDILTKVDVASMACSLECRSPLLDHHVVELAARMPIALKRQGSRGKTILVDTFADLLPRQIRSRPKMGFGVPLDHWFRNELKPLLYDILLDDTAVARGYFQPDVIRQLVSEHVENRWDHSYRLWSLVCLEAWHRTYLDPATPPTSAPSTL